MDDARRKGWVANLIPHEYVHSWCGKFRRPAGMCTPDFQTPLKTRLLWVYEGLTEYLGEVLMVRSGLVDPKEYRETLTATIGSLAHQEGRRWRPLDDTAAASHLLRGHSPNWNELRRGQDYYFEGALIWLEADAIIRERSEGKKSLDDFCRKFLGANRTDVSVVPYELPEIVKDLHELADFDWESFLDRRVSQPQESLPLEVVGRCGYRLKYATEPPGGSPISRRRGGVSARDSLGLSFSPEGQIDDVVPGMVGDRAGLAPGMTVIGVNSKKFSPAAAPRRAGRQRRLAQDRIAPPGGRRVPHGRARLRRRPALSRPGSRRVEARSPGRDPQTRDRPASGDRATARGGRTLRGQTVNAHPGRALAASHRNRQTDSRRSWARCHDERSGDRLIAMELMLGHLIIGRFFSAATIFLGAMIGLAGAAGSLAWHKTTRPSAQRPRTRLNR